MGGGGGNMESSFEGQQGSSSMEQPTGSTTGRVGFHCLMGGGGGLKG